jgi:hypothetical protein
MNENDRMVYKKDKLWVNKKNTSKKASSVHKTQKEAIESAREMLKNQGGGELSIKNKKSIIRDKRTIAPGNDLYPPKG